MPYGTVNLRYGVPQGETTITSTAGTATFSVEFGVLSALTGDGKYAKAAKKAVKRMWTHRTPLNLVGNHIDIVTGEWQHLDSSIGGSIDSFYEYLFKAAMMFSDSDYLAIFETAYTAIVTYTKVGPWYVEVHPYSGGMTRPFFGKRDVFVCLTEREYVFVSANSPLFACRHAAGLLSGIAVPHGRCGDAERFAHAARICRAVARGRLYARGVEPHQSGLYSHTHIHRHTHTCAHSLSL